MRERDVHRICRSVHSKPIVSFTNRVHTAHTDTRMYEIRQELIHEM